MGKHLDYKCTTWCRLNFDDSVDLNKVKQLIKDGLMPLEIGYDQDFIENTEWSTIDDCEEYLAPAENGGFHTMELYDEDGNIVCTNTSIIDI